MTNPETQAVPPAFSAAGLHEQVVEKIRPHLPAGSRILDLGAGAGALSFRLAREGYQLQAADYMVESFLPENIPAVQVDFDKPEQTCNALEGFDPEMIVTCEVIEHLKHPLAYLQMCNALLQTGKLLTVTLPNVTSPSSRINTLINGWPNSFGPLRRQVGHITPLFPTQVADMLEMAGFEVIQTGSVGPKFTIFPRSVSLRGLIQSALTCLLRPLMRNVHSGACMFFLARKIADCGQIQSVRPAGTGRGEAYRVRRSA
ncbi:MAG: class I SAM-dependent methyltransferase [Phycisphaerae bacterium]